MLSIMYLKKLSASLCDVRDALFLLKIYPQVTKSLYMYCYTTRILQKNWIILVEKGYVFGRVSFISRKNQMIIEIS